MILESEADTLATGRKLGALMRQGDVVTLSGPLSAGKTTLVRGLLAALGHQGEVPSPSFAIVQAYEDLPLPVWHADLYRLEQPVEVEELGLDDIRGNGALIVEWPEHGPRGAWPDALALSLEMLEDGSRRLTARVPTAWEGRWPPS